jgi:YidC/Oxa1 family membrane protein insertase
LGAFAYLCTRNKTEAMTRDNIIGLIIITAILVGYSIWMAPSEEEKQEALRRQDSIALQRAETEAQAARQLAMGASQDSVDAAYAAEQQQAQTTDTESPLDQVSLERMGAFSASARGEEKMLTLENDLLELSISTRGGHIHSAILKNYKTFDQQPLQLFSGEEDVFTFHFFAGNRSISTEQLFFTPYFNGRALDDDKAPAIQAGNTGILAMRAYTDMHSRERPSYIEFLYTLRGEDYMVDFSVNFVGTREVIASNTTFITLDWQVKMPRKEKNRENEQNNSTVFYRYMHDEVSKLRETRDASDRLQTSVEWISFKQQFFSAVLIAPQGFMNADISIRSAEEEDIAFLKHATASISIPYDPRQDNSFPMQMYLGPNHYRTLRSYELDLERQIPLGWGFFLMSWINRYAVIPVFNFLSGFNLNYGIIILILTVLLKIVLMPIAFKTYISQAKMRVLKPEIEEIGKKFPKKEEAMKKQQATMALYKKAGVNPMAGCVPMLLQLPILLALFRFFPASIELRQEAFLWADDLSSYDSILDLPFTIPFYGDHVSLFTLLMTISTIFYTRLNSQMMGSSQQMPGMKTMMYFMPVMLMGIFNNFASGLSYYYFLANVITFGQMYLFKMFVNEKALHAKIEENKKKPVKKSKWSQRMESLAKQQEIQQRKKKK